VERHELIGLMRELKLAGMRAAYDDVLRAGVQHRRGPTEILGDLLKAELAEKTARSIRYQMSAARFPVMKSLAEFDFDAAPVNEALVRSLHQGEFLDEARNAVFIGGTGTGKSHLATAIGANAVNARRRVRFFSAVDLVNRLEAELREGRAGRLAEQLCRIDFVIIDELGYLPFAQSGGQLVRRGNGPPDRFLIRLTPPDQPALRAHLDPRHHQPDLRRMADRLRRRQDDDRAPRPAYPSLRHRRDRQRELAHPQPQLSERGLEALRYMEAARFQAPLSSTTCACGSPPISSRQRGQNWAPIWSAPLRLDRSGRYD
jgi:hypothetical protein